MATDISVIVSPAVISTAVTVEASAPVASVVLATGTPGPAGVNGSDASVTAANVAAALGQSLTSNDSPTFKGIAVGDGTKLDLGPNYGQFTSAPGENAGFTINRGSIGTYASIDILTGADGSSGWSIQSIPNDTSLKFVNRVLGPQIICYGDGRTTFGSLEGAAFDSDGNLTATNFHPESYLTDGSAFDAAGTASSLVSALNLGTASTHAESYFQPAGSYATLVGGTVPASQLPSYVDDVLEFATLSAFPATGEVGKIYTATATNKIYRWSGSTYVEISPSPGSTDSVTEGSSNLYFTNARAISAVTWSTLSGKPTLFSGSYTDLTNKPLIPTTTDGLTEGTTNLYFTSARAISAVTWSTLTGKPTFGTSTSFDVSASGDASSTQVVKGNDSRLTNSRTPSAHASSHASGGSDSLTLAASQITGLATVATSGSYADLINLPVIAKKSSADIASTTTTLADVTGLTNFILEANTMYRFEFAGRHTAASGGSHYLVLSSSAAIANASATGWYIIFGSRTDAGFTNPSGNLYAFINRSSTGNTNNPSVAQYYIVTGSTAPTMKIQFSQTGTATGTSTLLSGAVAVFTKLI